MTNKKYIIKVLSPWMIDELLVYSEKTNFEVILLRNQEQFYNIGIDKLRSKNISVLVRPFKYNFLIKKIVFLISFFFKNIFKFSFDYNSVIGIKSIAMFLKIDLNIFSENSNIHAQFATQPALLAYMIREYFNKNPTYSFTFHAYDIYFKNRWFKTLVKNSLKALTISEYNLNYVNDTYGKSDRYGLVKLGVFRDQLASKEKNASEYFTLGLMSWFVEKKGIIYLLKAMLKLKNDGIKNLRLLLAGDGPLKEDILKFINENKLQDSVKYLGSIGRRDKNDYYNSLDTFILPSVVLDKDQDGIPVVLMEAIAYGLPLISTDVSGIPEICIDQYNGVLIKEKDIDEIVKAILLLMNEPNTLKKYQANSLELSKKYDIKLNSLKKAKLINWLN